MKRRKSIITVTITIILILTLCVSGCTISPPTEDSDQNAVQESTQELDNTDETDTTDESAEQKRQITILGNKYYYNEYIKKYVKAFTDIEFSIIESENGYFFTPDEIITRLLSQDDSFDIYEVSSMDYYIADLLEQGYYVDLSMYPEINDKYNHMYPILSESSKTNGEVFGFPTSASVASVLSYGSYYFDELGWSPLQIKTVDDLLEFSDVLIENGYENKIATTKWDLYKRTIREHVYNNYDYDNHYIDLDTPEFYKVLDAAKRIYDAGLVFEEDDYLSNAHGAALFKNIYSVFATDYYIPFPQITEQKNQSNLIVAWYIINPYSKNIDEAVEVLDILGEIFKVPSLTNFELYNDVDYYKESTIDLKSLEVRLGITQNRVDNNTNIYASHKCFFAFMSESYIWKPFYLYLDGEMEAEEVVEELQKVIDTISAEQSIDN